MAISSVRVSISWILIAVIVLTSASSSAWAEEAGSPVEEEAVLTLDSSNFDEAIKKHPFIVVEFYAPWCGHCKSLAPEYEKAAAELNKNDPPVILAKVDANDEINKELAAKYDVSGFPTLKIFKNGGENIQDYKGPREADGIVEYLKKQVGPASAEIKSPEDAESLIDEKKIFIVGLFPKFSGEEYENFMAVADKLRSDYDFGHTLDAKLLKRGDSASKGPIVRLFKPFDELVVDTQDFQVDALEEFIESSSMPLVTIFNKDPANHPYVSKFFNGPDAKAMLFMNFSGEGYDALSTKYQEVASEYKGKGIRFLIGDLDSSQGAFQYFGLRDDQAPLIILQENDGTKYLHPNVESAQIATFFKEYKDGSLKSFTKSEPIPESNNEPVKVVVGGNLHDIVYKSGKNVLLEFYAPWCGHCKKLAPILDEVAVSLENDADVIIAKIDATANDVPSDFEVQGYPTLYFHTASGKLVQYDGDRTKEAIIDFIKENKDTAAKTDTTAEAAEADTVKDEL